MSDSIAIPRSIHAPAFEQVEVGEHFKLRDITFRKTNTKQARRDDEVWNWNSNTGDLTLKEPVDNPTVYQFCDFFEELKAGDSFHLLGLVFQKTDTLRAKGDDKMWDYNPFAKKLVYSGEIAPETDWVLDAEEQMRRMGHTALADRLKGLSKADKIEVLLKELIERDTTQTWVILYEYVPGNGPSEIYGPYKSKQAAETHVATLFPEAEIIPGSHINMQDAVDSSEALMQIIPLNDLSSHADRLREQLY